MIAFNLLVLRLDEIGAVAVAAASTVSVKSVASIDFALFHNLRPLQIL